MTDPVDLAGLIERCRRGDELAWRALVERFGRYVYAITRAYGLSDADAEDVFQEVFLRTWRHLGEIRGVEGLRPWIGQVTRRLCVDRRRAQARESPDEDAVLAVDPAADVFAALEQAMDLRDALATLPPDCQAVLDAFFCRDRSYAQISEELDIPSGTIASRISRCLARLRDRVLAPAG
jgi:RNA polymerase sigma factor (sigma-70 family)